LHLWLRLSQVRAEGEDSDDEREAPEPAPVGTEAEQKERKLLQDIDAAVQKEAARQRRLKKTVSVRERGTRHQMLWVSRATV